MKNKLLLPSLLWGAVFDRDTEGLGPFNGTRNAQATYVTAVPEPSVALMPGAGMLVSLRGDRKFGSSGLFVGDLGPS